MSAGVKVRISIGVGSSQLDSLLGATSTSLNDDVCHDLSLEEDDDDDDNTMRKPIHATS